MLELGIELMLRSGLGLLRVMVMVRIYRDRVNVKVRVTGYNGLGLG